MGLEYWMITGVGIEVGQLKPFVDKEQIFRVLLDQIPDDEELLAIAASKRYEDLDYEDFLYGEPFDNFADLLTFCDNTNCLTYADTGHCDDGEYLYYPPSMPWHHTETEPQSLEEVHHRIVAAVGKITTLSSKEIDSLIDDDLYVLGCG